MGRQSRKNREEGPLTVGSACALASEARVMAASGLWIDLQEGLGQAETICSALPGLRPGTERCKEVYRRDRAGEGAPGRSLRATVPGIDLLLWRSSALMACGRGGEGT